MKVKDLIEHLKNFDQELDVYVCDEIEGNDTPLSRIETGTDGWDLEAKDVLMLRWN
jgi:hypothetical protein